MISDPVPRELGLSQFSFLKYLEEIDYLVHENDPYSGFRSHFFPSHWDVTGPSSEVEVIHRISLGRSSHHSSEPGVSYMQVIVLPKQWVLEKLVLDLVFRSLRTLATRTMGLFSSEFHLGSPDPIMLAPILANRYEKACSWVPALGIADSRVPDPGGSEGLRLDSFVDGETTLMTKKTSGIEQPTGWSEFWVPDPVDANKGIRLVGIVKLSATEFSGMVGAQKEPVFLGVTVWSEDPDLGDIGSLDVDPREGVKAQPLPPSRFSVLHMLPTMTAGDMGLVAMGFETPNPVMLVPASCFLKLVGKMPAMFLPSIQVEMGITDPPTPVFMPRPMLAAGSFGFNSAGSTLSHGYGYGAPEICVIGYGARVLSCIGDGGQAQASGGGVGLCCWQLDWLYMG